MRSLWATFNLEKNLKATCGILVSAPSASNHCLFDYYYHRLKEEIGSGQFGTVYKGLWQSGIRGEIEVAVKTLKKGSGEEDKVKFLQEAAIVGQFKHPNVVEIMEWSQKTCQ